MDIVYPPLAQEEALVVEVGEDLVNTSIMARLEVEAHPLPYFSDIIWTITSDCLAERLVKLLRAHLVRVDGAILALVQLAPVVAVWYLEAEEI